MNPKKYLGLRFLLRLLLGGAVAGFLTGYIFERGAGEFDIVVMTSNSGPILGLLIGLVVAVVAYLIASYSLFDYVTAMRDRLAAVGDLPFGFEEDLSLSDQAGAVYGLLEYEIERLNKERKSMARLSSSSRRVIDEAKNRDRVPFKKILALLENHTEEAKIIKRHARQLRDWVKDEVLPAVQVDFEDLRIDNADSFEDMIRFQQEIDNNLNTAVKSLARLENAVKPWEEGPPLVRGAVSEANQLIFEMSEVFRKFPSEELPENAEKLRLCTQDWESMAGKIERGVETLKNSLNRVNELMQELSRRSRNSVEPLETWEEIKGELNKVDNKVKQLKEATGENWLRNLVKQIKKLEEQAEWFDNKVSRLQKQLKKEAEIVKDLDELAKDLAGLAPEGTE